MLSVEACAYQPLESCEVPPPYVLLKSGLCNASHRWSMLGWDPWLCWAPHGLEDPLTELDTIYAACAELCAELRAALGANRIPVPVLMGALSYDLGRCIESVPSTADDQWSDLQGVLYGFRQYLITDEGAQRTWSVRIERNASCLALPVAVKTRPVAKDLQSNFTAESYQAAVDTIREMIAAGDCYQVNLSQQFTAPCARSTSEILREALAHNPAAMMGVVDSGDIQIVSTSPETLIRKVGDHLESSPIKGTRPRNEDPARDAALIAELQTSEKELAELNMIVDLTRNDLGRVSLPGSVQVESAGVIESFTNVHHRVATVSSTMRPEVSWGGLLRAVFPGASITGCPKPQAMRVIEQLEGVRRGFYCGSLGYIDCWGDGQWNIAIRTLTIANGQATFNLGGGIVYDSDPAAEYQETLDKGQTLFQLLS